ncbi:MAG: ACP S-malonyltransferase [Lachnospiraceae bacterium]|nr:ACP S-malonyltransferase [Lachnospiraceae bacterium]
MGKTAFIFPGQGAQYPGMGKDFFENSEAAREVFRIASEVTGLDLEALCFTENEKLDKTEYTQIAMITTELAMWRAAREAGLQAGLCAGLSLGEYAALGAAEVMALPDIFRIVRMRGIYMQNAYPSGGAMMAVLGLEGDSVEAVCLAVQEETGRPVSVANYNCPGQLVITGAQDAVERAAEACREKGAKRCIPLNVSGPFHSALLADAAEKLGKELEGVSLKEPQIPYLTNVTAEPVTKADAVKALLAKQICSPVRWQQSIERMIADGADCFIEIGPGKTLAGFMKRISKEVKVYNIQTMEDLETVMESDIIKGA